MMVDRGSPGRAARGRGTCGRFGSAVLLVACGACWVFGRAAPAAAQQIIVQHTDSYSTNELTILGANALLGGVTAGVGALLARKPVLGAVVKGTAGGVMVYGAKHLSTAYRSPGLGLAGRVLGATGASVVRNGAAGRGALDLIVIPLGPLTLYPRLKEDGAHAPVKLNVVRAGLLAAMIIRDDVRIDWDETLHLGAPVFYTPGKLVWQDSYKIINGVAFAGGILVSDPVALEPGHYPRLIVHERTHVIQDHFAEIAATGPVESWLLRLLPGGRTLSRYVDLGGVHAATIVPLLSGVPYSMQPWEIEAEHFADRYESGRRRGGRN